MAQGCDKSNVPSLTTIEMQLRKCCNHPYLIAGVEDKETVDCHSYEAHVERMIAASGKLVLLHKLLPKLRREGHQVLIFSQFTMVLDVLDDYLSSQSMPCERLDGNVTGNDRQTAIDRFCDPDHDSCVPVGVRATAGLCACVTIPRLCSQVCVPVEHPRRWPRHQLDGGGHGHHL